MATWSLLYVYSRSFDGQYSIGSPIVYLRGFVRQTLSIYNV